MYKNGYPCYSNYMIIVLVRVFMSMVVMSMVVRMWGEHFLEEIYQEKTYHKGVDGKIAALERFW